MDKSDKLRTAEDNVSLVLNGGKCTVSDHPALTRLEKLIALRVLRLELPNQSTAPTDLESSIRVELNRLK